MWEKAKYFFFEKKKQKFLRLAPRGRRHMLPNRLFRE
jgi:hypothetical protein